MRSSLMLKCLAMAIWGFASACASAGPAPWASSDYVDLYFRVYNGQVPLPHLRDAKQRMLFTHLIDPENLLHLQSAGVPQGEKQRQLEIILATLSALRSRYNGAISVGEPLAQELALVQAYELQAMGSLAKLSPQDARGEVSHPAWTTLIGGVIDDVENSKTYSPQQSAIMADALARNYPTIAAALSAGDRRLVHAEALKLEDAGGNAVLKDAREQIRRSVLQ